MAEDERSVLAAADVHLGRTDDGRLVLEMGGTSQILGSVMAAFPLTQPHGMVSLRDQDGQELGILDDARQLDPASREIMAQELERSYFMPKITDILDVKEDLGVVTWVVETDKGPRTFQVRRVRQNVRKMGRRRLVIKDVDGNRYDIRDWLALPPYAQKLIQAYL